jgi:hypothetical protein
VFARLERCLGLWLVQVIRSREVHDVDAIAGEGALEALVHVGEWDDRSLRARPLRRRADDAENVDAQPAQRVDVDDADEARSHDGRAASPR